MPKFFHSIFKDKKYIPNFKIIFETEAKKIEKEIGAEIKNAE